MKILYRIFLFMLIIGGLAHGLYGMFDFSLFSYIPAGKIFKLSRTDWVRVLIGISAIVVLLANFSISFSVKPKKDE